MKRRISGGRIFSGSVHVARTLYREPKKEVQAAMLNGNSNLTLGADDTGITISGENGNLETKFGAGL